MMQKIYADFCRLRDLRDAGREAPKYTEVQAFELSVTPAIEERAAVPFQERVQPWLMECFGPMIAGDREERNHRFLEEAVELVQANGCSASEAHQLVDYVFGRPVGEAPQEVGGVMVTLAALCLASDLDMHQCGEVELGRIWTKVEAIRAKQATKPKHSPLPQSPISIAEKCAWRACSDDSGAWASSCGELWHFFDGGGPIENRMCFCHFCSKPIKAEIATIGDGASTVAK
jgi:hypothetical protein